MVRCFLFSVTIDKEAGTLRVKNTLLIISAVFISLLISTSGWTATLGVEATRLKQISIDKTPLDVATATDGKLMFVLVPGEVLIFSNLEEEPLNRIGVDARFDRMTFAEKLDLLILSSQTGKNVDMMRIELISDISIEGSPYLGRADAPVTIAVFDDYQ
jgi:hypothetical protein